MTFPRSRRSLPLLALGSILLLHALVTGCAREEGNAPEVSSPQVVGAAEPAPAAAGIAIAKAGVNPPAGATFTCWIKGSGFQSGDKVLVELAAAVTGQLRATDLVGRYGGEEFVLLLPDSGAEAAARSIERILRRFRETPIGEEALRCTFSAGVAEIGGARTRSLAEYVAMSDAAMYEAKKKGKNCVVLSRDGSPAH